MKKPKSLWMYLCMVEAGRCLYAQLTWLLFWHQTILEKNSIFFFWALLVMVLPFLQISLWLATRLYCLCSLLDFSLLVRAVIIPTYSWCWGENQLQVSLALYRNCTPVFTKSPYQSKRSCWIRENIALMQWILLGHRSWKEEERLVAGASYRHVRNIRTYPLQDKIVVCSLIFSFFLVDLIKLEMWMGCLEAVLQYKTPSSFSFGMVYF